MSHASRLSLIAIFPLLLGVVALVACGNDDDHDPGTETQEGDWPAFLSLEDLVATSDAIVIATLLEESIEAVDVPPEDADAGADSVTEIIRDFEVQESLAGGLSPGDIFTTFSTASVVHEPHDGSAITELVFQVLRLDPGDTVLLFVSIVSIPEYYPDEWGTIAWAAPGEPHTARIAADGMLQWETTGRYDAQLEARNVDPGQGGAGEAFETTLEDLRTFITAHFDPTPEAPEPAPSD